VVWRELWKFTFLPWSLRIFSYFFYLTLDVAHWINRSFNPALFSHHHLGQLVELAYFICTWAQFWIWTRTLCIGGPATFLALRIVYCILWSEPFLDTQLPAAKPFWMDCLRGSLDGVPYYLLFWIPLWTGPIGSPWTLMNLPFGHLSGYASVLERRTGIFTVRASSIFYSVLMFLLKVLFLSPKGTPGGGVRFKRGLSV